jgi:hypothetical protein
VKPLLILSTALVAAVLAGCAGVKTDVRVSPLSATLADERTYDFARTPPQDASAEHAQYEALVREELARYGFAATSKDSARYIVSLAYDTRPAAIGVDAAGCGAATEACEAPATTSAFPGRRFYRHSLTLRFFEQTSGQEVYKVTVTKSDRDADPLHAVPYLVKSALARMPYAGNRDWRVTFGNVETGKTPGIKSVSPVTP